MCGIAGYLDRTGAQLNPVVVLQAMGDAMVHRGPDDQGTWIDDSAGLGLVHRRLAIVDLTAAGHQPMVSASGRYVLVYNGEIYNHLTLRSVLEGENKAPNWRGHSDTETLLAAIDAWGLVEALGRSHGMFALALWDRDERVLQLARDRMGEKPLYAGWQHGVFLFGSDLAAVRSHPSFSPKIDKSALGQFLRLGYVPAPLSIYDGICKVEPGAIMTVSKERALVTQYYWSFLNEAQTSVDKRFGGSDDEAVTQLEIVLGDAVERQLMGDVPLGAFLSGGIDSSLVVSLMQARSTRPVRTFTIGFDDLAYNEAAYARDVARHLGTDHTELTVTAARVLELVDKLPCIYSEPFADVSQLPMYFVAAMARQHVTVAMSGDGGDELFAGYNRYKVTDRVWGRLSRIPVPLRAAVGNIVRGVPPSVWDSFGDVLLGMKASGPLSEKVGKATYVLESHSIDDLYSKLISRINGLPSLLAQGGLNGNLALANTPNLSGVERMMALDAIGYLPDNVLVKVDRAAMAVSIETRAPMLDPAVVTFALSLPIDYKLNGGRSKWPLRRLLERYVPPHLTERPKMGFAVPIGQWLRGPLKPWAESLLDETPMREEGYLNHVAVHKIWARHLSGREDFSHALWHILSFQNWLRAGL